jgi:hypothetical protein
MPAARTKFAELTNDWNSRGLQPVWQICATFMMQLVRESDWAGAMEVFDMCVAQSVLIAPNVYDALLVGMCNAPSQGPHAERILRVLRSLPSSCAHNRDLFVARVSLAIRGLVQEHIFVDAMRLFDLLLDVARQAPDQYALLDAGLWQTLFQACADYGQAVQAIALWRVAARYEQCSSENRDTLVLTVTKAVKDVDAGSLQLQHAIGWAADESLVPADWLQFVVTDAVDGAGSLLACRDTTLNAILSAASVPKLAIVAVPLVRVALERPHLFSRVSETFTLMMRVLKSTEDRQLESLAESILTAARDCAQLSSDLASTFMIVMMQCDRADRVLELFRAEKAVSNNFCNDEACVVVLAAQFLILGPSDQRFAEMERLYNELNECTKSQQCNNQMRVIVRAAATQLADADRFTSTGARSRDETMYCCLRIQRTASRGNFVIALKALDHVSHHWRLVHFEFVVEKVVQQMSVKVLPALVEFALRHKIGWCKSVARVLVRLCDADALTEFVDAVESANTSELFRTELLNNLRDNGPHQLAVMTKLLNAWLARGPVEADHASIVAVAAFRAEAHNLGWQVYRTLIEKTQSLSDVHCASVIREGLRFVDELWAVMDEFEEHGVTMSGEVWTSAFDTIDKRMRSSALAMQAFERMSRQQPVVNAASAYASAIGCLDALASVEAVLAHMRAAQVTPNASLFLAVLRFRRRERQLELAERMMLEYIHTGDAVWHLAH